MARLFLIVLLLSGMAVAKEQLLLTATNDKDARQDQLLLRLDQKNRPTHLIHRRTNKPEKSYSPDDLNRGIVLRKESGKDLLVLRTTNFRPDKGADISLQYLYNGIPPADFRTLKLKMKRAGGVWSVLQDKSKKPIKAMKFKVNWATVFGFQQAVGIREILLVR